MGGCRVESGWAGGRADRGDLRAERAGHRGWLALGRRPVRGCPP